jgi:anaerobic selenocysteine-containing dehydrogenase
VFSDEHYLPGLFVREDAMKGRRAEKIVISTCTLCGSGCGILVHLTAGETHRIPGDPEHPTNQAICIFWEKPLWNFIIIQPG